MSSLKAKLTDNVLKIYLPLREPKPSASGKNLVIATTMGCTRLEVEYQGQQVLLNANAMIRNSEHPVEKKQEPSKKTLGSRAAKPK
jgi:hypothetical protein